MINPFLWYDNPNQNENLPHNSTTTSPLYVVIDYASKQKRSPNTFVRRTLFPLKLQPDSYGNMILVRFSHY